MGEGTLDQNAVHPKVVLIVAIGTCACVCMCVAEGGVPPL